MLLSFSTRLIYVNESSPYVELYVKKYARVTNPLDMKMKAKLWNTFKETLTLSESTLGEGIP